MGQDYLTIPIRGDKLALRVSILSHVYSGKSEFQTIDIIDTDAFGRILLLDGHVQLATLDEHAYHEALVQIPALAIESLRKALIVGGGDGGVLRELCKHHSIEHIDMVEIDAGVVEASKQYLPTISAGAFDDSRLELHIADAFPFVKSAEQRYDLIVVDSTDTYEGEEGELSEQLFSKQFYEDCFRALSPGGFVVTQADNLLFCPYSLEEIQSLFASVFPRTGAYQSLVPSFGGFSGYCWGSKGADLPKSLPAGAASIELRYLNPTTYDLAFAPLPF